MTAIYPFSAVIGQSLLKTALLISVVDPKVGGVLISGPRGTAKSTIVRSLTTLNKNCKLVTLPLGATEEMLVGSINLEKALQNGKVEFSPGLLEKADRGLLYVDEVNLLPDHLVDLLLDVASSGVNSVERDGISYLHNSRFVLIGTMNPDEGELRPQLLDRFGLMVDIDFVFSIEQRQKIVARRLEFDQSPDKFMEKYDTDTEVLERSIDWAKNHLDQILVPNAISKHIAELCANARVDGFRADITLYRTARAHAALNKRLEMTMEDVKKVAEMVFKHRRDPHVTGSGQTSESSSGGSSTDFNESSSGSSIQGSWGMMKSEAICSDKSIKINKINRGLFDEIHSKKKQIGSSNRRGKFFGIGNGIFNFSVQCFQLGRVHWFKTFIDFENLYTFHRKIDNLHPKLKFCLPRGKEKEIDLILLDTSASTLENSSIRKAKGLIRGIASQNYLLRRWISIITFGNSRVKTVLHPQRSPKNIDTLLDSIQSGGGTPFVKAIDYISHFLRKLNIRFQRCCVLMLTDGRVEMSRQINLSALSGYPTTMIDIELSDIRLGLVKELAKKIGAQYQHINSISMVN